MKRNHRTCLGVLFVFLGLLLNPFVIEKFSPDQNIDNIFYLINIVVFQLLLIVLGIVVFTRKTVVKLLLLPLLAFFLVLSGFNGHHFLQNRGVGHGYQFSGNFQAAGQTLEQVLLDETVFYDNLNVAQLSYETGEILYTLHENSDVLKIKVPENGVLDAAVGIDPSIIKLFRGQIRFDISSSTAGEKARSLFRKTFDLAKAKKEDFFWHRVMVDLSAYSGKEITMIFSKNFRKDGQNTPEVFFDLLPTDFMFWKKPQVRPKNLSGKKNIVLISLDALRADHLHFIGYERETSPNLDRIVEKGTYFTEVVSQAPWTTPSHFSIFTSTYPSIHGGNQPVQSKQRSWNDFIPTMGGIFQEEGYLTGAFTGRGSISAKFGFYKGFDFYNETTVDRVHRSDAELIFKKAGDWIEENRDRTFCLFVHTYEIHHPYVDEYFAAKEGIKESDVIKHRTARYDGDIRKTDVQVGRFMDRLEKLGLIDKTLVVILSDHGEDMGGRNPPECELQFGHAYNLYDELLLVPLIFLNPEIIPAGKKIDYQVRLIDVLPTIADYLGIKIKTGLQGKSLRAMINGSDNEDRPAYSEATSYGPERESIRYNGFKYVHRISYGQLSHPTSKGYPLTPLHELYDLEADPGERVNLAEKRQDLVKKYQELILSIVPNKELENFKYDSRKKQINISKDKKLMETLKSLGYIK